ncbi:hypothetical protein VMCG_06986 [Cytospora schulzeri]|uniref:Uncharacterized protein n=1 Tax=Cytospora schulzeri TaxID=448051 RepID=A0A423W438_9PEZI|nr:hypothetical protein VMCG_06986 [Valsa malicola]
MEPDGGGEILPTTATWNDNRTTERTKAVQPVEIKLENVEDQLDPKEYRTYSLQEPTISSRKATQKHQGNVGQSRTNSRPNWQPIDNANTQDREGKYNQPAEDGQEKSFEARSLEADIGHEDAGAAISPSNSDVATPRPGQEEPQSYIRLPSEKFRRHFSANSPSSYTVFDNAGSLSRIHDIEPEACAYIIKDGKGHPMPRSFNRGLGDRVLEMVGLWSSQKSLYRKLAFLSNDDMAALQTILTSQTRPWEKFNPQDHFFDDYANQGHYGKNDWNPFIWHEGPPSSPPKLNYRQDMKPSDYHEQGTLIPEEAQVTTSHGTRPTMSYALPPIPSRRPSLPYSVPETVRPTQERRTPYYPSHYDARPYDTKPDHLVDKPDSRVDQQINALLLEWTPASTTERPKETAYTEKSSYGDDSEDSIDSINTMLAKRNRETSEERRRKSRAKKVYIDHPDSSDTSSSRSGHLDYGPEKEIDQLQEYKNKAIQGDRREPDSLRRQPTVEAVSEEALPNNPGNDESRDAALAKGDDAPSSRDKGKQPLRQESLPLTGGASTPEWARKLVEETKAEPAPYSMKQPQGDVFHRVGGPQQRPSSYVFNRPTAVRQYSREFSSAWSHDERADKGVRGIIGTGVDQEFRLRRSRGSPELRKSGTF